MNSIYFVTHEFFTADGVHCNRRECVNTTPQMTRFRGAKSVQVNGKRKEVTITTYSLTTSTKVD